MAKLEWTVYYAGHGAMNYIEVKNDEGEGLYKIVIDAGSNDDGSCGHAAGNFIKMMAKLWEKTREESIIICITHYDEDHYNYLEKMYSEIYHNMDKVRKIYCGSLTEDDYRPLDAKTFIKKMMNTYPEKVELPASGSCLEDILVDENEKVSMKLLWNCITGKSGDKNGNTAAYVIKNEEEKTAFVFTGDMTGNTFIALEQSELIDEVGKELNGYEIYMTVPHHGSIHSLMEGGFIREDYSMEPLINALRRMNLTNAKYFISSGIADEYKHPDALTASTFKELSAKEGTCDTELIAFVTENYPGYEKDLKDWIILYSDIDAIYGTTSLSLENHVRIVASTYYVYSPEKNAKAEIEALKIQKNELTHEILCRINNGITLFELLGEVGPMYYYENGYLRVDDLPISNCRLVDYEWDGLNFKGTLDVSESKLSRYEVLQNIQAEGCREQGKWICKGSVEGITPEFSPLPFQCSKVYLELSGEDGDILNGKEAASYAELVFCGQLGSSEPMEVTGRYGLLMEESNPHYLNLTFGEEGLLLEDSVKELSQFLGLEVDLSEFLPSAFPFVASMRLFDISLGIKGDLLSQKEAEGVCAKVLGFTLGYQKEPEIGTDAMFSLGQIKLAVGLNLLNGVCNWIQAYISSEIKFLGQSIHFTASYPQYRISLSASLSGKALLDAAAEAYGMALPSWLQNVAISSIWFEGDIKFKNFSAGLKLDATRRISLGKDCYVGLSNMSFCIDKGEKEQKMYLDAGLSLEKGNKMLAYFMAKCVFSEGKASISASLLPEENLFDELYQLITGYDLPQGFPSVELGEMGLTAEYADAFSIRAYEAGMKISVEDTGIFGMPFSFDAEVTGDKKFFLAKGSFQLGEYFTIYAAYEIAGAVASWKFGLKFAQVLLQISYTDSPKACICGEITADLKLKDAVNYMIGLFDPEGCYVSSDTWSFLDGINLKGTQVIYYFDSRALQISVKVGVRLPFGSIEKISVVLGKNGVDFQMVGSFMDQNYTEEAPLIWDAGNPPEPSGGLMKINYLLLAEGIQLELGGSNDVELLIKQAEEQIYAGEELPQPVLRPEAGFLAGMDLQVADTVQIQFLYDEWLDFYGARFYLYGDKAGVLKGLDARISYARVNDRVGVFSGKVVPPAALQNIKLGDMSLGIGSIEAVIYTDGNFSLDLGYPQKGNFARSFRFRYGVFSGEGGIYVRKGISGGLNLPKTEKGYFSPVLAMGIGMKLGLSKGIQAGILAASASLVMQGLFEGVYATYLSTDGKVTDTFYRVNAQVSFVGKLQGNVDFGLVGASVTVSVSTRMAMQIEAYRPVRADIDLYVEAAASIKILFCRIKFHFSLKFGMEFLFSKGGRAPWDGNLALEEEGWKDEVPLLWTSCKASVEPVVIPVRIAVVYGMSEGRHVAVLGGLVARTDFAVLVDKLSTLAGERKYLQQTDGGELFDRRRFFRKTDWLYDFLAANVRFEFSMAEEGNVAEQDVWMPLPEYLTLSMDTFFEMLQNMVQTHNLADYMLVDDAYCEEMERYYEDTRYVELNTAGVLRNKEPETVSMAAKIFTDYFELLIKALRAEKENSRRLNRAFTLGKLTAEQLENVIGMCSRFMLGGKRGFSVTEAQTKQMQGLWKLAGFQFGVYNGDYVVGHRYQVKCNEGSPAWISFSDGQTVLETVHMAEQVAKQLPALQLPQKIFKGLPELIPFFEHEKKQGIPLSLLCSLKESTGGYYTAGESFQEGEMYVMQGEGSFSFALLLKFTLSKCSGTKAVYEVKSLGQAASLGKLLELAEKGGVVPETLRILYTGGQQDVYSVYEAGQCIQLSFGVSADAAETPCVAELSQTMPFLQLLYGAENGGWQNMLLFQEGSCPFTGDDELTILIAVHMAECPKYQRCFNGIWLPVRKDEPVMECMSASNRSSIEQGCAGILAETDLGQLAGDELLLAEQYLNLAMEVEDVQSGKISHETIPFIGTGDVVQHKYQMVVSYSRALDGSNADEYSFVTKERQILFRLFWVDVFGNRMSAGQELRLTPKYIDALIPLGAYSSMELVYRLVEGAICLIFRYTADSPDTDELKKGIKQLEQLDVSLRIYSSLIKETVIIEKAGFLEFLKACLAEPEKQREWCQSIETVQPSKVSLWLTMETWIYVFRKKQYLHENAPEAAAMVRSEFVFEDSGELPQGCYLLHGEAEERLLFVKNATGGKAKVNACWAWLFLPTVTGWFKNGDKQIELSAFDLQEVFEDFMKELRYLSTPFITEKVSGWKDGAECLARIVHIRRTIAKAMAARIYPTGMNGGCTKERELAVRAYAEKLLLNETEWTPEGLLFLSLQGEIPWLDEQSGLDCVGIIKENEYPIQLTFMNGSMEGCGAVTANMATSFRDRYMEIQYIYERYGQMRFTPQDACENIFRLPFVEENNISMPASDTPRMPVLLGREAKEGQMVVALELLPGEGDSLCIVKNADGSFGCAEENATICNMYEYFSCSRKLEDKTSEESLRELIGCMENYADALLSFKEREHKDSVVEKLLFRAEGGQWRALEAEYGNVLCAIEYSVAGNEWHGMKQNGRQFLFEQDTVPVAETRIRFRLFFKENAEASEYGYCMVRHSVENSIFDKWSANSSF